MKLYGTDCYHPSLVAEIGDMLGMLRHHRSLTSELATKLEGNLDINFLQSLTGIQDQQSKQAESFPSPQMDETKPILKKISDFRSSAMECIDSMTMNMVLCTVFDPEGASANDGSSGNDTCLTKHLSEYKRLVQILTNTVLLRLIQPMMETEDIHRLLTIPIVPIWYSYSDCVQHVSRGQR